MNPRPIALVGLRCAGKTAVGRELALLLRRPFVDLDAELLSFGRRSGYRAGSTGELLEVAGRARFRDLEATALRMQLEPQTEIVLAAGGGLVERKDNRVWLRRSATTVWLDARDDTLLARLGADPAARPSLTGLGPGPELGLLRARRGPLYEEVAALRLATDDRQPAALARELADALAARGSAREGAGAEPLAVDG
jgi:shikimate kinase